MSVLRNAPQSRDYANLVTESEMKLKDAVGSKINPPISNSLTAQTETHREHLEPQTGTIFMIKLTAFTNQVSVLRALSHFSKMSSSTSVTQNQILESF